jgi:hypothetical protein
MLRLETPTGYYLITHPDHAHLAGRFAEHWGNDLFIPPEPRQAVLHGIHVHDDGWLARDAHPTITHHGKPSAFSIELVGKYSAFEEIDLAPYLAVRESAVAQVEKTDPYAALIISMHTYNLLTERSDRTTIAPADIPLLDGFLHRQRIRQETLHKTIKHDPHFFPEQVTAEAVFNNFRLLQACDNLSLLSCVAYTHPATLLHPLPTCNGSTTIAVHSISERSFRLIPYPFDEPTLHFQLPARHVKGHAFASSEALAQAFHAAPVEALAVTVST